MNKFLLDTHILLWSLLDPDRLKSGVISLLEDDRNEKWLSPITTWEIIILAEKGKIKLDKSPVAWIKDLYETIPFKQAPLNHEVAIQSTMVTLPHRDPADRFIAATAIVYDLTLVTSDKKILSAAGGNFQVLKN